MSRLDEEFVRYGVTLKDLVAKGGRRKGGKREGCLPGLVPCWCPAGC